MPDGMTATNALLLGIIVGLIIGTMLAKGGPR